MEIDLPAALLKKIAQGQQPALTEFYHHFSDKVYNTAISYLKNVEDAEEVTQDVFIEIYRSAAGFKYKSKVSTWIYRLTVNKSLDMLRKRNAKKRFGNIISIFTSSKEDSGFEPADFHHPGVELEQKEDAAKLFKAIGQLVDAQKTAFILSHLEGLKHKEIAEIMETTTKSVESLIGRAKANLRKILEKEFPQRGKK